MGPVTPGRRPPERWRPALPGPAPKQTPVPWSPSQAHSREASKHHRAPWSALYSHAQTRFPPPPHTGAPLQSGPGPPHWPQEPSLHPCPSQQGLPPAPSLQVFFLTTVDTSVCPDSICRVSFQLSLLHLAGSLLLQQALAGLKTLPLSSLFSTDGCPSRRPSPPQPPCQLMKNYTLLKTHFK